MRDVTLADIDLLLAQAAPLDGSAPEPEALVVLLYPKGSPFELYTAGMREAVEKSQGRVAFVHIDTGAEPHAPARFRLSGAPGLVLFVNGKQMAAFAVPFVGAFGAMFEPMVRQILENVGRFLPPGTGRVT